MILDLEEEITGEVTTVNQCNGINDGLERNMLSLLELVAANTKITS